MASITQRGPFQFQATVRRKGYKSRTCTFENFHDAKEWAKGIEANMHRGYYQDDRLARTTTLDACLARYATDVTPEKKGVSQELSKINVLRRHPIAKLNMAEVRSVDVANYIKDRRASVSGGTVARELCVLSKLFRHARHNWGFDGLENPCQNIDRPSPGKPRKGRISEEDLNKLCLHSGSPVLATALRLAVECAMRRGELVAMEWKHVNLEEQTVYLPDTKNGDDRTVPLSLAAVELLRGLSRDSTDGRVFSVRADAITRAMSRACKRAGLSDVRFHDSRREGTARLVKTLGNALEVSAVTGHKDWRTLRNYYQPDARELAKRLG
jgi:integrase